jgi:hypothetical protein
VLGGTTLGSSYLGKFANCPNAWFNSYYRPVYTNGKLTHRGIYTGRESRALLVGDMLHEGIAAMYLSGCYADGDRGNYKLDAGIETVSNRFTVLCGEGAWEFDDAADEDVALAHDMIQRYHPVMLEDYPEIKVAFRDGEPLVETEVKIPLSVHYNFTCKIDLIVETPDGIMVMEHKTVSPAGLRFRRQNLDMDPQFCGEILTGRELKADLNGVIVNMINKKIGKSGEGALAVIREETFRTEAQIEQWRAGCIDLFRKIDYSIEYFASLVAAECTIEEAGWRAFPCHGQRDDHCHAYFSECGYYPVCRYAGRTGNTCPNGYKGKVEWNE